MWNPFRRTIKVNLRPPHNGSALVVILNHDHENIRFSRECNSLEETIEQLEEFAQQCRVLFDKKHLED